jgi:hypothetical protein
VGPPSAPSHLPPLDESARTAAVDTSTCDGRGKDTTGRCCGCYCSERLRMRRNDRRNHSSPLLLRRHVRQPRAAPASAPVSRPPAATARPPPPAVPPAPRSAHPSQPRPAAAAQPSFIFISSLSFFRKLRLSASDVSCEPTTRPASLLGLRRPSSTSAPSPPSQRHRPGEGIGADAT